MRRAFYCTAAWVISSRQVVALVGVDRLCKKTTFKKLLKLELTRQFDRPTSNGMAALSREDTTPQSSADAHCSSAVQ